MSNPEVDMAHVSEADNLGAELLQEGLVPSYVTKNPNEFFKVLLPGVIQPKLPDLNSRGDIVYINPEEKDPLSGNYIITSDRPNYILSSNEKFTWFSGKALARITGDVTFRRAGGPVFRESISGSEALVEVMPTLRRKWQSSEITIEDQPKVLLVGTPTIFEVLQEIEANKQNDSQRRMAALHRITDLIDVVSELGLHRAL